MIGSLFAGHEESPGETIEKDGKFVKEYFGSASEYQKGEKKNVEGKKIYVEHKGSLKDTLTEMEQDLQSSISYAVFFILKCENPKFYTALSILMYTVDILLTK